jgi:hypothetical protein
MVREIRPPPLEEARFPVQPMKGVAFVAALWSATCLAQGWTGLHAPPGPWGGSWMPFLNMAFATLFLHLTIRHARLFVRREDWPIGARPPKHQWLLWLGPSYIAAVNIRSIEALTIAVGLTALFATGLILYFHAHRTPEGDPFRRSDSETAR